MFRTSSVSVVVMVAILCVCKCCLITNCPRGGKRNGHLYHESNLIKQCVTCGPGWTGQCFGPNICCGPFGCLLGTAETLKCQQDGFFNEPEPCLAGISNCRKNTGRCASEGICCSQYSCHFDGACKTEDKPISKDNNMDSIYNIFPLPNQFEYGNEINSI